MASDVPPAFISVVITVRNEEANLLGLLQSLESQERPYEVLLVDAQSRDRTYDIAQEFARRDPQTFRVFRRFGSRGVGRNVGVAAARGECVAFIDGDCIADSHWLAAIREGFAQAPIVAGRTQLIGKPQYGALERVELYQSGNDVTFPSCNLGYRRELFLALGGFDPRFITAEDIDLNLRAVRAGATIRYAPEAVVYHRMRGTFVRFLYQAFWNGYGRKQLTEKHGNLWDHYRPGRLIENQRSAIASARLTAAMVGYLTRVVTGGNRRLSTDWPSS